MQTAKRVVPLYSEIAERAVLGSALLDNSLMRGPLANLSVGDLSRPNGEIFAEMLRCSEDGMSFDITSIAQTFQDNAALIGGLLDGVVATPSVIGQHVKTILECSRLRELKRLSEDISSAVESGKASDEIIQSTLARQVQFLQSGCDLEGNPLPGSRSGVTRSRLKAVSVKDLLAMEIKPREMLLEPILPEQGLVMLYGYRGTGKTFLGLGIAFAVATGGEFLNWKALRARKVLYVDGELPAKTIQDRIRAIVGQDFGPERLRIVTPDFQDWPMPDLSTESGQLALEPLLEGIDLVVLDNLSALCRTGNENEGEDWMQMQEWMLRLRKRGMSVLFLHHAGKNKSQRGTSKREDLLDVVICLRHPSDYDPSEGLRCEIHFEKTRGFFGDSAKSFEVAMQEDSTTRAARWSIRSTEDANTIRSAELFGQGMSVREVAEELSVSRSAAGRLRTKWKESSISGGVPLSHHIGLGTARQSSPM